jgi:hypothetical protein
MQSDLPSDGNLSTVLFALGQLVGDIEAAVEEVEHTVSDCLGSTLESNSMVTVQKLDFVRQSLADLSAFLTSLAEAEEEKLAIVTLDIEAHVSKLKLGNSRHAIMAPEKSNDMDIAGNFDLF